GPWGKLSTASRLSVPVAASHRRGPLQKCCGLGRRCMASSKWARDGEDDSAAALQSDTQHGQLQADALVAVSSQHPVHLLLRLLARRILRSFGNGWSAVHCEIEFCREGLHAG